MDIKQAIRELQKWERQRMAAIHFDKSVDEAKADEMIGRIYGAVDAWVDMAEAAIELVRRMRDVPSVEAHKAAKAADQQ